MSTIGAIRVNSRLQTADKHIYAIGDCAESVNFITGKHEYWPLGSISTKMGRIAADNIAGRVSEYHGFIGTTMFQNFGVCMARTGLTFASARENGFSAESIVITGLDKAHYSNNAEYVTLKLIADAEGKNCVGSPGIRQGRRCAANSDSGHGDHRDSLTLAEMFGIDLGYSPWFNNPMNLVQTACCMLAGKIEGFVEPKTLSQFSHESNQAHVVDVSPFSEHIVNAIPGSINVPLENLRREGIPFDKKREMRFIQQDVPRGPTRPTGTSLPKAIHMYGSWRADSSSGLDSGAGKKGARLQLYTSVRTFASSDFGSTGFNM